MINQTWYLDCLSCGGVLKQASSVEGVGYKTAHVVCTNCGDRFDVKVGRRETLTVRLELQQTAKKKARR